MDKELLRADLNLLKVLHVLLEERSVTKAAERMFVTQSAVSRSLQRLRQLFDDPLLIRSSHGLVPTKRAQELAVVVGETIERVNSLITPRPFEPGAAQGTVRIAAPESFVLAAMPRLTLAVRARAPELRLQVLHLPDDYLKQMEEGQLDFVINHEQPYPDGFSTSPLTLIRPLLWFRKEHPLEQKKEINLSDICSYPIISFHAQNVSQQVNRQIWETIEAAGLPAPNILIDTSHLLLTLNILVASDVTMLGIDQLSQVAAFQEHLASRPLEYIPTLGRIQSTLSLLQHERTVLSPLHIWMAEVIRQAFLELSP